MYCYLRCGAVILFSRRFWCGFCGLCGLVNTLIQIYTYVSLGLDKEGWYVGLSLGEIVHNWIWALGKATLSLQLSGFGLGWKISICPHIQGLGWCLGNLPSPHHCWTLWKIYSQQHAQKHKYTHRYICLYFISKKLNFVQICKKNWATWLSLNLIWFGETE